MIEMKPINKLKLPIIAALIFQVMISSLAEAVETEEIVVGFKVHRLIERDIMALYGGGDVYLPVMEIFGLLDLNIKTDNSRRRFSGFIISKKEMFEIDLIGSVGRFEDRSISLSASDYVITPGELYLRLELFEQLFGLDMEFDYSELQVNLKLNEEFPSFLKMKRRKKHEMLLTRKTALKDIKRLERKWEYLGGGVVDWSLSASPYGGGGQYYNLAFGGMLLGGDLSVVGGGNSISGFDYNQLGYKWHYYLGDNHYLSQAELGDVYTNGLLARQLRGGLFTNRPQTQRKFFQTIDLSGQLEEGWEVELYINNQLTDFTYTDYSGEYNFNIDINYGTTDITLKMYGPNGEILTERRHVGIPYNLIPGKQFEYYVASGISDANSKDNNYIQAGGLYGINNSLTIGIGSDFPVGSEDGEKPIISGELTGQVAGNMTANASLAPGYAGSIGMNYIQPSMINIDFGYTRYFKNRFRNRPGQLHRLAISISSPLKIGQRYYSLRYSAYWNRFPLYNSINMNYGFNTSLLGFYYNYMGQSKISIYPDRTDNKISSDLFISPTFIRWLKPQLRVSYDHDSKSFERYGIQINRRLFKSGQLSISYERNEISGSSTFMLTFKILSSFADFSSRVIHSGDISSITQMQRGSAQYDKEARRLRFTRRNGVGYGSAVVRPFVDLNYNGVLDRDEKLSPGLKARIQGGRESQKGKGKRYYYDGLRAYDQYLVEIDPNSLDNPLLVPAHDNYEINCNPNIVTAIDVPLVTASQISGKILRRIGDIETGQGGITLNLINLSKESVTAITTFSNGEFYYLGLVPGLYRAYIDLEQLERYGYVSEPNEIEFLVEPVEGGMSIEDINFVMVPGK